MKKTNVLIKIGHKTTSFIVTDGNRVVFWDAVTAGEWHIINDVSQCLRVKFNDAEQLTKAKDVCLSKAVGIKEDNVIAEIIEARLEQIFQQIKEQLQTKEMFDNVKEYFITKDDNYIPSMDLLLKRVMDSAVKTVALNSISIKAKPLKNQIADLLDSYF